eukprot:gi/632991019/ref/XP_007884435.1/ PREDICTED: neurofilament medium polypeptide-like [Callorhinchus milii]
MEPPELSKQLRRGSREEVFHYMLVAKGTDRLEGDIGSVSGQHRHNSSTVGTSRREVGDSEARWALSFRGEEVEEAELESSVSISHPRGRESARLAEELRLKEGQGTEEPGSVRQQLAIRSRSPWRAGGGPVPTREPETQEALGTPTREAETPTREAKTPTREAKTPTQEVETPTQKVETPTQEVETPTREAKTPTREADTPTREAKTPTQKVETPTREASLTRIRAEGPAGRRQVGEQGVRLHTARMQPTELGLKVEPAELARKLLQRRGFLQHLSVAFDDTEYEPYGLPDVVQKGFGDIPAGPSCPHVLRRALLSSLSVPEERPASLPTSQNLANGKVEQ